MAHLVQITYLKEGQFDFSGWLGTKVKKSDQYEVRFFVLKGVYLTIYRGDYEGNEGLRGPLKQVPDGFVPDFEWLRKTQNSDSSINGARIKSYDGLEFAVKALRWSKMDLCIRLQAENEKDKAEWMEVLERQVLKIKNGEIRKPRKEEVAHLSQSGKGYNPATGDLDPEAMKVTSVEERNYTEILFKRFLEPDSTGVSRESFQELLTSFGLGEGLSEEELRQFVTTEFEQADKSQTGQLEFEEFLAAYNRLVELQKEKVKDLQRSRSEYVVGKWDPVRELVPQNAAEGLVINPGWVKESKYSLLMRENVKSWSSDDFSCKDSTGKTVIRCEGKVMSIGSDIRGFDGTSGDLLFHLEEIAFRITTTFLIKDPKGKIVATLRKKIFSFSPDITVYEGAADFDIRGNTTNKVLFKIDGPLLSWQFKIRNARGETIAWADERLASNNFAALNTYYLEIAPGVDSSLIAGLCIACDCAVNDN